MPRSPKAEETPAAAALPPIDDPAWEPVKDWIRRELELMHTGSHGVFVNNEAERRVKNP